MQPHESGVLNGRRKTRKSSQKHQKILKKMAPGGALHHQTADRADLQRSERDAGRRKDVLNPVLLVHLADAVAAPLATAAVVDNQPNARRRRGASQALRPRHLARS